MGKIKKLIIVLTIIAAILLTAAIGMMIAFWSSKNTIEPYEILGLSFAGGSLIIDAIAYILNRRMTEDKED